MERMNKNAQNKLKNIAKPDQSGNVRPREVDADGLEVGIRKNSEYL